jgi:MYND finger/Sel1 repeat
MPSLHGGNTGTATLGDPPKFGRYWCCGAVCCGKCFVDSDRHCQKAVEAILGDDQNGPPPIANEHELQTRLAELNRMNTCPFCRTYLKISDEGYMQRIKFHAESKDWAQYEMSDHCLRRSDIPQAVKWLEKAAALGHTMARGRLGEMCQNRGLDVKAHGYMLPAARSGHVAAQFFCAEYAQKAGGGSLEEAVTWCLLAAGQGFPAAQRMMGEMCFRGKGGINPSVFAAIVWLRKAALQQDWFAQSLLAMCLLQAKKELFDGCANSVGYSVMPEVFFWQEQSSKAARLLGLPHDTTPVKFEICGCCEKGEAQGVTVKRCARCKAIVYCGRDCQAQHWNMGHKVDCKSIDAFKKILKRKGANPDGARGPAELFQSVAST